MAQTREINPNLQKPEQFEILAHRFEPETGLASFHFSFDTGVEFRENIFFGPVTGVYDKAALDRALRYLNIDLGISYFKAFMPDKIVIRDFVPDAQEADFLDKFYRHGLGEMAWRNGVDIKNRIFFEGGLRRKISVETNPLPRKSLVLIGGGKDSLVSIEALRHSGEDITLFAVNPAQPILDCMEISELPRLIVKRAIDPQLFELNKAGVYNGHVPITGIISFIAAAASIIHGYDTIILSNERSASEPTVDDVNHQYSKSLEFERDISGFFKSHIAATLNYFSFLRPLSEIGIVRLFAREEKYDHVFTSCNKAYSITNPMKDRRWCGECPKCLFVFLALATAVEPERLVAIFGSNLLDNPELLSGYRELSGLAGQKPWECVGEILESASALYYLSQQDEWKNFTILKTLKPELEKFYGAEKLNAEFIRALAMADAPVPPFYMEVLKSYAA